MWSSRIRLKNSYIVFSTFRNTMMFRAVADPGFVDGVGKKLFVGSHLRLEQTQQLLVRSVFVAPISMSSYLNLTIIQCV